MRGHFLDLNLIELANTLMQALLDKALQDLLPRRVLFDKLGWVFRTIEG